MVLARSANRVLWVDDAYLANVAKQLFGCSTVWTQLVLSRMASEGRVDGRAFFEASARLLGFGYTFTGVNPPIMEAAGHLAEWRVDEAPLKQAISVLETTPTEDATTLLAALFVRAAYRAVVLPELRHAIVVRVLRTLQRRPGADARLFTQLESALGRAFSLDALGAADACRITREWRRLSGLQ